MNRLLIIGANEFGIQCAKVAEALHRWDEIVFADEDIYKEFPYEIIGQPCVSWSGDLFTAIDDCEARENFHREHKLVSLIHPTVQIGERTTIGNGTVIFEDTCIGPDNTIGDCVIIGSGVSITVDCHIEDYSNIGHDSIILDNVRLGSNTDIGICSVIEGNVTLGSNSIIPNGKICGLHGMRDRCVIG